MLKKHIFETTAIVFQLAQCFTAYWLFPLSNYWYNVCLCPFNYQTWLFDSCFFLIFSKFQGNWGKYMESTGIFLSFSAVFRELTQSIELIMASSEGRSKKATFFLRPWCLFLRSVWVLSVLFCHHKKIKSSTFVDSCIEFDEWHKCAIEIIVNSKKNKHFSVTIQRHPLLNTYQRRSICSEEIQLNKIYQRPWRMF